MLFTKILRCAIFAALFIGTVAIPGEHKLISIVKKSKPWFDKGADVGLMVGALGFAPFAHSLYKHNAASGYSRPIKMALLGGIILMTAPAACASIGGIAHLFIKQKEELDKVVQKQIDFAQRAKRAGLDESDLTPLNTIKTEKLIKWFQQDSSHIEGSFCSDVIRKAKFTKQIQKRQTQLQIELKELPSAADYLKARSYTTIKEMLEQERA
jgi:hypothetical protein